MVSVDEDLGLDDRNESGLLANAGVPRETMGSLINSVVCGAPLGYVNAQGGPPLGETSALGIVELAKTHMSVDWTSSVRLLNKQTCCLYKALRVLTTHLSYRPSRPLHQVSPSTPPTRGLSPVSTLMPGITPWDLSTSTNGVPSAAFW